MAIATSAKLSTRRDSGGDGFCRCVADTARRYAEVGVAEVPAGGGRRAMAAIAANFFGRPETQIMLTGVTGNERQDDDWRFCWMRCSTLPVEETVLVGTIENHVGGSGAARAAYHA